ncbi:MAG: P-loop NTPase fold protein [Methanoregula sp.]|uniref:KAP family P-loop NTPase fold protein n=1 Tax=Methanoregula sp. TaxID=2052170 RepID=UPI003C7090A0
MPDPNKNFLNIQIFSDSPKDDANFFNFDAYVEALSNIIENPENKTPITIAINGKWGSGKTSLMRTLQKHLGSSHNISNSRNVRTVWFNAWKYSDANSIFAALIQEIFYEFRGQSFFTKEGIVEHVKTLYVKWRKQAQFRKIIFHLIKVASVGLDVSELIKDPEYKKYLPFYDEFQKCLNLILKIFVINEINGDYDDSKGVLVIFIDDLDRCSPKSITSILESINLFFDQKGCIFIIGMDINFVSNAVESQYKMLGADESLGKDFIKKIIQLQFNLPAISSDDVKNFIENEIKVDEQIHQYIEIITNGLENNPREIKQFLNSLNFLRGLGRSIKNLTIEDELLIKWCILDFISEDFVREVKIDNEFLLDIQIIARKGEQALRDSELEEHQMELDHEIGWGAPEAIKKRRERYDKFKNNSKIIEILKRGNLEFDFKNIPKYICFSSISPKEPDYPNTFVTATASTSVIAQGDRFFITGTATGNPFPGVAIWIFGENHFSREIIKVNSDSSYSYEIKREVTQKMDPGQYFVVIEHPLQDNKFEVDIIGNFVGIPIVWSDSPLPVNLFPINGPGSLHGIEAAEAVINAIKRPRSDEIYTKIQFIIQKPVIHIDPINDHHIGDKFTITATTNLAVGDNVLFTIYSLTFPQTNKIQSHIFKGASGTVQVTLGEMGLNMLSFDVDSSTFKPDEYIVKASAVLQEVISEIKFKII